MTEDQTPHLDLTDSVTITNDNSKGEPRVTVKVRSNEHRTVDEAADVALTLYENTMAKLHKEPQGG